MEWSNHETVFPPALVAPFHLNVADRQVEFNGTWDSHQSYDNHPPTRYEPPQVRPTYNFNGVEFYNFKCWIDTKELVKTSQDYSTELDKLYVMMDRVFTVKFSFDVYHPQMKYFIRAQPTFSDNACIKDAVRRCPNHLWEDRNDEHKEHVLRCETGEPVYTISDNSKCSVTLPLKDFRPSEVLIKYKFACKTSCVDGMSRKPIHILYTLENADGNVLGTSKLNVKISHCPKRDMEKEVLKIVPEAPLRDKVPMKRRRTSSVHDTTMEDIKAFYTIFKGDLQSKTQALTWIYKILQKKSIRNNQFRKCLTDGIRSLAVLKRT